MSHLVPDSILVLRHELFEHLGYFADILTSHCIPFVYKDLGEALSLEGQRGLIIMGGPQSANDAALATERRLIAEAIGAGIPVLGICLGAQLVAKALGARVYANSAKEFGWAPVMLTEAACTDPVFSSLASPSTFFHWHRDTFDLPRGAEWLAYSELCRHQAFRYGTNVYGIQFHPEVTPQMITDWTIELDGGPVDPYAAETGSLATRLFEGWLSTF